jgi:hypothetical protein
MSSLAKKTSSEATQPKSSSSEEQQAKVMVASMFPLIVSLNFAIPDVKMSISKKPYGVGFHPALGIKPTTQHSVHMFDSWAL